MANYANLKSDIAGVIRTNNNEEITGDILQEQLLGMVDSLGAGFQYKGVATPTTAPGTPDENVFYIASTAGTYTNFGGLVVAEGEVAILKYNGSWAKEVTGAATAAQVTQLGEELFGATITEATNAGTPSSYWKDNNGVIGYAASWVGLHRADAIAISPGMQIDIVTTLSSSSANAGYVCDEDDNIIQTIPRAGATTTASFVAPANSAKLYLNYYSTYTCTKKGILTFDDVPTSGSDRIVKSGGVYDAINQLREIVLSGDAELSENISSLFRTAIYGLSIYKETGVIPPVDILGIIDASITNKDDNYYYWLQVNKNNTRQQVGFFRTDADHLNTYTSFVNLVYKTTSYDEGVVKYSGTLASGETLTIVIDWEKITQNNSFSADKYQFKDFVFSGGRLSEYIFENPVSELTARVIWNERTWAACGDSITNANHTGIENIPNDDPYAPFDGTSSNSVTYKRKNYAYYIAMRNQLKWGNYGWGGSTLHHCAPKGYAQNFAPFVDSRIENLASGVQWDYISIFFGWNDVAFGPTYQRDLWLQETYGEDIGYPVTAAQIGASGFATQAQKDACDSATGMVGGVQYDNTDDYFFARFVGTIGDSVKTTWFGAWNYALSYLMKKYPNSKILIVAPFLSNAARSRVIKQAVHDIAEKWGVNCFDFEELPYWYYPLVRNYTALVNPDSADGRWYTGRGDALSATIDGYNQARLSWDTLHPSALGYKILSDSFGAALLSK